MNISKFNGGKMKKRKKRIPTYIDYDFGTTFIQDRKGLMKGRKKVRGKGDSTAIKRVRKDFDGFKKGQIVGRTERIPVRKHKRKSKRGRVYKVHKHYRKVYK